MNRNEICQKIKKNSEFYQQCPIELQKDRQVIDTLLQENGENLKLMLPSNFSSAGNLFFHQHFKVLRKIQKEQPIQLLYIQNKYKKDFIDKCNFIDHVLYPNLKNQKTNALHYPDIAQHVASFLM